MIDLTMAEPPLEHLRQCIANTLHDVKAYNLPAVCKRLGLASGEAAEAFSSKRSYVLSRISGFSRGKLLSLAREMLYEFSSPELEDAIELADPPNRVVSELIRRRIGKALNSIELSGGIPLLDFLRRLWPIDMLPHPDEPFESFADAVYRRMVENDDWSNDYLLERLGAYTCSQRRFFQLLEQIAHPNTRQDEAEQEKVAASVNQLLKRDGFVLAPDGDISGFPIYRVQEIGNRSERPLDAPVSQALSTFDTDGVHRAWTKALERRATDPEGAITAARTLLETVCKHILDELGEAYTDKEELPKLYRMTAEKLNLAPDQYTEQAYQGDTWQLPRRRERARWASEPAERCARQGPQACTSPATAR